MICIRALYVDFSSIPATLYGEAIKCAQEYLNAGIDAKSNVKKPVCMDWEQDAQLIIPAVNKVLGTDVRGIPSMHWWTFMSAYMEIGEGTYSMVLNIRNKRAAGKKLEKWEKEFERENMDICRLKPKLSEDDRRKQEEDEKALSLIL